MKGQIETLHLLPASIISCKEFQFGFLLFLFLYDKICKHKLGALLCLTAELYEGL